jgi:hypothetical protein
MAVPNWVDQLGLFPIAVFFNVIFRITKLVVTNPSPLSRKTWFRRCFVRWTSPRRCGGWMGGDFSFGNKTFSLRSNLIQFDGRHSHGTCKFTGERHTVVFYPHASCIGLLVGSARCALGACSLF